MGADRPGTQGDVAWLCFLGWADDAVFAPLLGADGGCLVQPDGRFVWGGYYEPGTLIGGDLAHLIWAGEYPGPGVIQSRLYIGHVFLLPVLMATLIGLHLTLIVRTRHTQFRGVLADERHVIGTPMWPGYALRSLALMALVAALLFAPPFDLVIGGYTVVPAPFWGGVGFPTVVFGTLYLWPWIEQRFITRDWSRHELLDRPRDNPRRTAIGAAFFAWVVTIFAAGAADRVFLSVGVPYDTQVWIFRGAFFVVPAVVYVLAGRLARELRG